MSEKVEIIAELKDLVSGNMDEINKSVGRLENQLGKVDKVGAGGSGIMKSVLGANLLTGAISGAGGAVMNFAKDSVMAFSRFEQFQTALTTMFHGNRDEATQLTNQLQRFAKETPFELTEIQAATKQMLAFGSSSTTVVQEMRMLGDVSSGIGAPLGDLAYLYGTIRTQGRAMTMDINQFANRGIPIWKELEKITGKSGTALRKYVEEGKIGFPQIQQVFENMTKSGGQFFNLMDAQSKTLGGQLSNLTDAWDQLQVHLGQSKAGVIKIIVDKASAFISMADTQVNRQNERAETFNKYGVQESNFLMRQFNAGNTKAFENQQTDVMASTQLFGEYLGKKDIQMANIIKGQLEEESKNILFRIQHASLMERTTGRREDLSELGGRAALLADGLKNMGSALKLFNKSTNEKLGNGKGGALENTDKLDALAKANRPTQYYITIKEQIHEVNLHPQNLKEGTQEVMSILSKGLMAAVNDISVLSNNR